MDEKRRESLVLAGLIAAFAALAVSFYRVPAVPSKVARPSLVPPQSLAGVAVPGTIRISAGQLISSGGDASGLQCYACHDKKKPPEIKYDAGHRIVLPKEHADLIISMRNCAECHPSDKPVKLEYAEDGSVIVPEAHRNLTHMAHGRNERNENCYNCHDPSQLDQLHTPEGLKLKLAEATLLCAGCHGPTYRDWEAGIHGRTGGYWNQATGKAVREECTSCHDPHAPAFPKVIPMPGPHPLHPPAMSPDQTGRTD